MTDLLLAAAILLLAANLAGVVLLLRRTAVDLAPLHSRLDGIDRSHERGERALREEVARSRDENTRHARELREEVTASVRGLGDSLARSVGELATMQKMQLDDFRTQLGRLTESNEQKLESLRTVVDGQLQALREDNTRQLEQMRHTVDEKLQGTLEQRLGESFKLVSERLEQVHRGLGEMQTLASGVGDLKKVLSNVKVRGTWGEVQLASLLEQILTPDQYAANVPVREHGGERVEFALKLPGRGDREGGVVWLPIDAKFPQEDYLAIVDASERGDPVAMEQAAKALAQRIRDCARSICDKYLDPPQTTDFGIMFLPTEGLYAEVIRRPGLVESVQRECRVVIAGPTTLAALLNSLQMGFRTLAIEKRSSEVWAVLGGVKTEFANFGGTLDKVKKKLQEASNAVERVQTRTRVMGKKLRDVEELPAPDSERLLLGGGIDLAIEEQPAVLQDAEEEPVGAAESLPLAG
jgi:DNA recombination protein RmuC